MWDGDNPVKPDNRDVRVTVYKRPYSLLIAYASWANNKGKVTLHVDWDKTGMASDAVEITAPAIERFQPQKTYSDLNDISSVPVGRRGIILIKKK